MKIRYGFVSNSSSSSFLVYGCEFKDCPRPAAELTTAQKKKVKKQGFEIPLDKPVFLTAHFSDTGPEDFDLPPGTTMEPYCEGGHGGPYTEEDFTEISDCVWLKKGKMYEN